jgi:hypothetical protein
MPILRPSVITRRLVEQESDEVLLPVAASLAAPQLAPVPEHEQTPKRYVAAPVPLPSPMPQRYAGTLSQMAAPVPLLEVETPPLAPEPTLHEQITAPLPVPVYLPGKRQPRNRIVRILLLVSCISFLLATSILAYGLLVGIPGMSMHPAMKVDHIRNQRGQAAPPTLQLSTNHIDFGANVLGAISTKTITLTNAGGGQIFWQAGSNSPWLTISPAGGTFSGSVITTLTVNRANLAPGDHTGYITFIQQGNTYSTLKVTTSVNPLTATGTVSLPPTTLTVGPSPLPAMVLTTNALTFGAIQGTNPASQQFTISNPGNAPLDWAITQHPNATTLISVSPTNGIIPAGNSATITVAPKVIGAKAAVITGHIIISDTDKGTPVQNQQVMVKITISNQAVISLSTASLTFNSTSTTEAPAQLLTITNTGSAQLIWTLSPLPSWLLADIPSGTLAPNESAFVNVTPNSTGLSAGHTYTYTLVVSDTDPKTPVISQNVQVTLIVK